jgi:hypothetical protein
VEAQQDGVTNAYWRYYRLCAGSREERLAAEKFFWAREQVDDVVHNAPIPAILTLVDELLAHPAADTGYVGAGPVEDLLHLDAVVDWDEELARRCVASAAWREAVYGAAWPEYLNLPRLRPYLRAPVHDGPSPAPGLTRQRRRGRDTGQRRRPQRG